jgi:octaprenyl-diphosphate synthase
VAVTLPLGSAIDVLYESRDAARADPALRRRLEDVQAILAEDLGWVEQALAELSEQGVSPATEAAQHLVRRGGKRVRPLTMLLSSACFGKIPASVRRVAMVTELVHSATLLHDDVADEGMVRRGVVSSRLLWGNAVSVLSGDLLLVHALTQTHEHAPEIMPELLATMRDLVDGEVIQLRGRTALDLSEETYERILRGKTASLFVFAARSGARLADAPPEAQDALAAFGLALGMAFQLVDDVLDYSGERSGKTLAADLREGKLTLPLVLATRRDARLVELVRRIHAGDQEPIELVRQGVVESGACREARDRAAQYTERALGSLAQLPPSPSRSLLERVALELVERAR